jgi:glycosyltransferase involved in cell wall biosynthesis
MRHTVVHLTTSFGVGGTERQLVELLRGLDAARWRAKVYCFRRIGPLLAEVERLGISPELLALHGSMWRPNTARVIARLARALRDERAALLHCHDIYAILVGVPAARLAGVPVLAARRDLGHHLTRVQRPMLRLALRGATRVLANAATVASQVEREDGIPASRIAIVPNGLDLPRFDVARRALEAPAPPLGEGDGPVILTVGRMTYPAKGHDDLVAAIPEVLRHVPAARFVVAGDGPREPEIRALAERLGVSAALTFLGRRGDVPALLARADLVCHPARMEGLPNAVMEAMAAARPLVATAVGGTPELVQDGVHGRLVPPEDPPALAAALVAALRDPAHARELARAARRRIEESFSVEGLVRRVDRLYAEMVGDHSSPYATSSAVKDR